MLASFLCFLIAAIIFLLIGVKVDLGTVAKWDFIGLFFLALGLCVFCLVQLNIKWPVVRQPNP